MPGRLLSIAIAFGFLLSALITIIAMTQPRFAERLVVNDGQIVLQTADRQMAGSLLPPERLPATISPIEPLDLTPEPDAIESYQTQARFFARQDALALWLRESRPDSLSVLSGEQLPSAVQLTPSQRLPFEFWMQILVGFAIFVISAWIWALQPRAWPNRLFGLAGAGLWLAASTAAVYSTRWLALPTSLFLPLSSANGFGAMLYGAAMISLFLIYPVRLVSNRALLAVGALFGGWFLLGLLDQVGSPPAEVPLLTAVEMLLILILVIVQFVKSRKNPLQRAAIRWVGVSTSVGSGLFISAAAIPAVLGIEPLIDQSYAFAFFLIVHLGVAFGLRRNALFQSEQWAITMFRAAFFGLLLIAVDILLITLLGSIGSAAVLTLLLLLPFFYLPWRSFMQRWLTGSAHIADLLEEVAHIALVADVPQRARQWQDIFDKAFSPLQVEHIEHASPAEVIIADEGLAMHLPAAIDCPAMTIRYRSRGTRLFQERDRQLAARLIDLASSLKRQQEAFKQGVSSERSRISRDLHDDLSARLVSGLMLDDPAQLKAVLRSSLAEVRSIVTAEESGCAQLADILADCRAEAAERLEASGMALHWPVGDMPGRLDPQPQKALVSVLREIVTNAVKHSGGSRLTVEAKVDSNRLYIVATDDGRNFNGMMRQGNGLRNMRARMTAIEGYFDHEGQPDGGFRISLNLPVTP